MSAKKLWIGIDYSMTCPSFSVCRESFEFKNISIHFLSDTKKYQKSFADGKIVGHPIQKFSCDMQRFEQLADVCMSLIEAEAPDQVFVGLEGYSMASSGRVFHIAENTGILKYKLYKAGINVVSYAPATIKKLAAGTSYKIDKDKMYESFCALYEEFPLDLKELLSYSSTKIGSPIGDIVDSYFILKKIYQDTI